MGLAEPESQIPRGGDDQHQAGRFHLGAARLDVTAFDLDAIAGIHLEALATRLKIDSTVLDEDDGALEWVEVEVGEVRFR